MVKWKEWQANAKLPTYYDPQGLQSGYIDTCCCVNWYGLRSPVAATFAGWCLQGMCTKQIEIDQLQSLKPLMSFVHPNCPSNKIGIFWLRDLTQPSSLITLHDAEWQNARLGYKSLAQNWVKANTCAGTVSTFTFLVADKMGVKLKFEISPNQKWILFSYPFSCCGREFVIGPRHWAYVFIHGGFLSTPSGERIEIQPGDMLRLDFANYEDSNSDITYMYLIQKIDLYHDPSLEHSRLDATKLLKARANADGTESFWMSCDKRQNTIQPHLLKQQHIVRTIAPTIMNR